MDISELKQKMMRGICIEWKRTAKLIVKYNKENKHNHALIVSVTLDGYLDAMRDTAYHLNDQAMADDCSYLKQTLIFIDSPSPLPKYSTPNKEASHA